MKAGQYLLFAIVLIALVQGCSRMQQRRGPVGTVSSGGYGVESSAPVMAPSGGSGFSQPFRPSEGS